jgi:colicin import membrane protein
MLLSNRPGYVLSGSAHAALLVATLLSFAQTRKFDDAQESVAIETVTDQQFNEVMKGDKTAKEVKPLPRADKVADLAEQKPLPPVAEAKRDVPTPPPPLKREPDPGEGEPPQPAAAKADPVKPAPVPPPRPEEKPLEADAEAVTPKPPPHPEPPKEEPKKPDYKPDQMSKLLEDLKQKEQPKQPDKAQSKPKSGDETEMQKLDVADIKRFLSKEAAQRKPSANTQLQQVASLGAANASAAKMSPSMRDGLDDALRDQFRQCWSYIGLAGQSKYVPVVQVEYAKDGTLIGQPVLLNPPSDPAMRNLAESAMRAVRRCNPLHIPAVYQPFYDYWKGRNVRFDPDELS